MKKFISPLLFIFTVSFSDEITAYKVGFVDGFRVGISLKKATRTYIPGGYWLLKETTGVPYPLIAFYVFYGNRKGFNVRLTEEEIVFGVYKRYEDAEFYRKFLESKGIVAKVEKRNGRKGWKGYVLNEIYVSEKEGVSGVIYHLKKAIEKAKEIDPTVLNRNLLIKDLETILKNLRKWEKGEKGYSRVIPEEKNKSEILKEVKRFLEEE